MSLTEEAVSALKAKVEPRPSGTLTKTGLLKLSNGTLVTRPSTELGYHSEDVEDQVIDDSAQQLAELEAMRAQMAQEAEQPKKRGRKKAQPMPDAPPETPRLRQITINIPGFGGIPSQYTHVYLGEGVAVLGLSSMSFTPQGPDPKTGQPSSILELSVNPGVKYVYLGNTFIDRFNIKNLLLVEMPEGDE
jgi:hypothetical protein